jgi:ubiquinone/menaquinone biosynthesis C-methylase UbiE
MRIVRVDNYLDEYRYRSRLPDPRAMAGRPGASTDFLNARIRDALSWPTDGSVLDVGCGDGSFLALVAPLVSEPVGIAPTTDEVERLREYHRESRIRFDVGTADRLPIADGTVDVVVCNGVFLCLSSVAEADAAVREIRRTLKPGGVAWIGEVLTEETSHSPASIGAYLRRQLKAGPQALAYTARRAVQSVLGRGDLRIFRSQLPLALADEQFRSMALEAGFTNVVSSRTVSLGPNGPVEVPTRLDYRLTR